MIKSQTYIKQNRIQREVMNIINIFKVDWNRIRSLENKGIAVYNPKRNKVKLSFMGLGLLVCLITPFTNLFMFGLIKWGLK